MNTVKLTASQLRRRLAVMAVVMVIVPAVMVPVSILALRGFLNEKLAQPAENKLQLLEAPHFKQQGIRTVEQYDAYWKAAFGRRPTLQDHAAFYTPLLLLGALLAGAWFFKRWALLCGLAFAGFRILWHAALAFLAGSRAGLPVVGMVLIVLYGYLFCLLLQMLDAIQPFAFRRNKFIRPPDQPAG